MICEAEKLNAEIQRLENELEKKYEAQGRMLAAVNLANSNPIDAATINAHKKMRSPLVKYFFNLPLRVHLTSPFVYGMIVPFAFMDVCVTIFQAICFRAWDIPRIRRADHVVVDRHHLIYLNGIEKLNCIFCGYANGVVNYTREVAGRTEEYWCPIKHEKKIRNAHGSYREFTSFGDAQAWSAKSKYPRFWQ